MLHAVFFSPRAVALVAVTGLLSSGCGILPVARKPLVQLSFRYAGSSGDNRISQTLSITNPTRQGVVPVLDLSAVDKSGKPLPGVTVTGVYGSDRGGLVAPGGTTTLDILRFTGVGVDLVSDVRAVIVRETPLDYPVNLVEPVTTPRDADHEDVTRNDVFTSVGIRNDNEFPITARLVYIVWDSPPDGATQQAQRLEPIGDLVTVGAHTETEVQVPARQQAVIEEFAGRMPASIKAYFSA
jgi:hypothetical protein